MSRLRFSDRRTLGDIFLSREMTVVLWLPLLLAGPVLALLSLMLVGIDDWGSFFSTWRMMILWTVPAYYLVLIRGVIRSLIWIFTGNR